MLKQYADPSQTFANTISLHVALVDAIRGYETMLEKAEPSFAPTVNALLGLHRAARTDLEHALRERGAECDSDGSFMGAVHTTVVTVRSLVDDIDQDLIPQIVSGEENNLEKYDQAIIETAGDRDLAALVHDHREKLVATITALRANSPEK
jgi:hypothetical protein